MKALFNFIFLSLFISATSQTGLNESLNLLNYKNALFFDNGDIISVEFDYEDLKLKKIWKIEADNIFLELNFLNNEGEIESKKIFIFGSYKNNLVWLAHGEHWTKENSRIVIKHYEYGFRIY